MRDIYVFKEELKRLNDIILSKDDRIAELE